MESKKLVSFRCSERDWELFKIWADSQGMTATDALTAYIQHALGKAPIQPLDPIPLIEDLRADMALAIAKLEGELEDLKKL